VPEPVRPHLPQLWTPPVGSQTTIDFALGVHADGWTHHPAWGDPSFDTFKRIRKQPFHRGAPPYEWPVNGFLFEDPKTRNWYAYVGLYCYAYKGGPDKPLPTCTIYRSTDRGLNWEHLGPLFPDRSFRFDGDTLPANLAPDVSVLYHDGLYHLAYDWSNDRPPLNADAEAPDRDSGAAYAWAESPEGPWHRWNVPIIRNSWLSQRPLLGKYDRAYATSLIRRADDWLVIVCLSAGAYRCWATLLMTTPDPKCAPEDWSEPLLALSVEDDTYFPPLVEIFPAFCHDGYVYAPGDALGADRTFQLIPRAPIEHAHRPDAWEIYQHGCAWHAEDVPHEALGIFGQTFSGSVDPDGRLNVLFSACDSDDIGSVNVATRPWAKPIRDRGFHLAAHKGPALTLTRCAYRGFELNARLTVRDSARIVWGYHAPLTADRSTHDATLHPLSLGSHQELELNQDDWRILSINSDRKPLPIAEGRLDRATEHAVSINRIESDRFELTLDDKPVWAGTLPVLTGAIGLLIEPGNHVSVSRFEITGEVLPAQSNLLYMEAFLGAGLLVSEWDQTESSSFRFGVGAVRRQAGPARAKWNFRGQKCVLWSPKGPDYGRCRLRLDGSDLGEVDLHAPEPENSQIVFTSPNLDDAYHALVIESITGRLVLDCLQTTT